MKRNKMISVLTALVLTLTILAGCGTETGSTPSGQSGQTSQTGKTGQTPSPSDSENPSVKTDETAAEPEPDYSWFAFPEETNTLVLYSADLLSLAISPAVEIFEKLYPEVHVEWHKLSAEEFEAQIRTEIPAGKGPDLLYANGSTLPDVYKTMSAMLFEDLCPYMVRDEEFRTEDYIEGIMDGGVLQEKQYLLPVSHSPSLLTTSEELLAEAGVTLDELATYDGFIDACTRFCDVFPGSNFFLDLGPYDLDSLNLQCLWDFGGFHPIDYENNTVALDEAKFRMAVDLCRLYSGNDPNQDPYPNSDYALAGCILNRDCLFSYFGNTPLLMKDTQALIRKGGETALFLTPPDIDGGKSTLINSFGAIPTMSPNKLNAWRMLKILLSYDVQSNPDALKAVYPVRKDAVSPFLKYSYYEDYAVMEDSGLDELLLKFDHAYFKPPVLIQYVKDAMMPCIQGNKSFDDCYKKLLNTLELYKDE